MTSQIISQRPSYLALTVNQSVRQMVSQPDNHWLIQTQKIKPYFHTFSFIDTHTITRLVITSGVPINDWVTITIIHQIQWREPGSLTDWEWDWGRLSVTITVLVTPRVCHSPQSWWWCAGIAYSIGDSLTQSLDWWNSLSFRHCLTPSDCESDSESETSLYQIRLYLLISQQWTGYPSSSLYCLTFNQWPCDVSHSH